MILLFIPQALMVIGFVVFIYFRIRVGRDIEQRRHRIEINRQSKASYLASKDAESRMDS